MERFAFGYYLVPIAAIAGLISPLIVGLWLCSFLFGAAGYAASAARSNHIQGNTKIAWYRFVPILNLYLFFKKGQQKAVPSEIRFSRYVIDPFWISAVLIGLILAAALTKELGKEPQSTDAEQQALHEVFVRTRTTEENSASVASLIAPTLPSRIDENTTLRSVEAKGDTLRLIHRLDLTPSDGLYCQDKIIIQRACSKDGFGPQLAQGGHIIYVYETQNGAVINTFDVTKLDCEI